MNASHWVGIVLIRAMFVGLLLAVSPGTPQAALRNGSPAPAFTAHASIGGSEFVFSMADALKHGPVVLYFYPAAFTEGCTVEAHDFADAIPSFEALGATVVGVSGDTIDTLKRFSVSECQGKFALVADSNRAVMKAYDSVLIPLLSYADRTSYVIIPDGQVLYSFTSLDPDQHVANTIQALSRWRETHPASR
jgi:peroxiredoxin Q/BCP